MSSSQEDNQNKAGSTNGTAAKLVPIVLVTLCAFYALSKLRPPQHEGDYDLKTFGQLPVQQKGRVKPLDTVARNSLLIMRGKQTVPDGPEVSFYEKVFEGEKAPKYLSAIEWFAELTLRPTKADEYKVFRIDHPEVLGLFGFEPGKAKYFSFNDLFHSNDIKDLRTEQDKILQEVNDYVTENPDAAEKDKLEMRKRLIPQFEEVQDKLDSLIAKVTEVERAIRSIKLGEDLNRNNVLDTIEDLNKNGKLDLGEDLNGNGLLDVSEDLNKDGKLNLSEDLNSNGRLDMSEDLNENGELDPGEDLNNNGMLDLSEDLNEDGKLNPREDLNSNGLLDISEDLNENGKLDPGPDSEKYTPYQSNLAHLYQAVTLYDQLKNGLFPHHGGKFFGTSYSKEIKALAFHKELSEGALEDLRQEVLASGALENESKLMEILSKKPKAMELIQADQSLKASEPFLRGQARFASLGIVPPDSFEGKVSIENGTDKMTASEGKLDEFLQAQSQVKIGSYSAFDGIWRENQLREKLIKSVGEDGTATLTNVHEGRYWIIDFLFYLSFAGIAFGVFRGLNRNKPTWLAGSVATLLGTGLVLVWLVLFGVPSATVKDVTVHNIDWTSLPDSLLETRDKSGTGQISPIILSYADLSNAYQDRDHAKFNGIVKKLSAEFEKVAPYQWHDLKNLVPEHKFNGAQPFVTCMALYLIALIFVFLSWLIWQTPMQKSAVGLTTLAFVIHILGLVVRIWIQGRPPVTNLYSSSIFISLGAVFFGLIFERIYRNGIGTAVACIVGFGSLVIAHGFFGLTDGLDSSGDTMEMLQAVLDTNFWLATHVVCITMGYVAMFVAGSLAIIYVLRGILDRRFDKKTGRSILSMIFGITCFAVIFSFVGTMLGGIWADDSWGRFWGWDPKENGALLIVIWSAIVLHARFGGLAKDRGIAALAIFGNIVTSWSWFGTNLLGEGLHNYGFSEAGFIALMWFVASQLLFIAIAYLPQRFWLSELGQSARKRKAGNSVKSSSSTKPSGSQ
jgi:ABC-type transport system involved in cytochrome c biogenesis permease subunit